MRTLLVYIEIQGKQRFVGRIEGLSGEDARFCYDEAYRREGVPISVSLPLRRDPFDQKATKTFFEGLLPEGFTRRSVAQWLHADEDDYLSILSALGKECLGALRIFEENDPSPESASYRKLSPDQVRALAAEGSTRSTEIVVTSHLSLTGASGKVGLYLDEISGDWYQPIGMAPSTHIVKQRHVRLQNIVINELFALRTASHLGLPSVESNVINTGNFADAEVLLSTKRYDRLFSGSERITDGLLCPLRLHQEDFSQALGIPSSEKYEPAGGNYLSRIFSLLKVMSSDPIKDQQILLDLLIFDTLIGNTDNHIKNLSLLYGPDMRTVSLAPAYDLVSTVIYGESDKEMSIAIAGERRWQNLSRNTFIDAANDIGIAPRVIGKEYDRLAAGFPAALTLSASELEKDGFSLARQVASQIMESRG